VLADDDLDIDTKGVRRAKDLKDTALRGTAGCGEVGDLDVDGDAFEGKSMVLWGEFDEAVARLSPQHAVGALHRGSGEFCAVRDGDGAADALVEGGNEVATDEREIDATALRACIVKDAHNGGITAGEHACDATGAASITARGSLIDKHKIALHSSVDLVGRNEDIVFA
jgi:hypothetical protein